MTSLDEALASDRDGKAASRPTQADQLVDLAKAVALFHASDGTAYADIEINGHRETWPIRSKGFKLWLTRRFYVATQKAARSEALKSALNVIDAAAHFDAPEHVVYVRVGSFEDRLYIDLGDDGWRAIEIDLNGWRIISDPPVRFRRADGMRALPEPKAGGSIETLRSFVNVQPGRDFVLLVSWMLAALRGLGPYPVLVISGEQVAPAFRSSST